MQRAHLLVSGMLVELLSSGCVTKLVELTAGIRMHSPPPQLLLELNVKRKSHHLTVKVRHSHLTTGKNGSHIVKSSKHTVPVFHLCGLLVYSSLRGPCKTTLKISADKSNLWYTESKAKFTHTIKMVYTGTTTASSCFARSMQSAVSLYLHCLVRCVVYLITFWSLVVYH